MAGPAYLRPKSHFGPSTDPTSAFAPRRCNSNRFSRPRQKTSRRGTPQEPSGRTPDWLNFNNPAAPAVKREAEEDWAR
jgi:hypothetical protein